MPKITRQCDFCQVSYLAETKYLKRNQGRYCSRICSATGEHEKRKLTHEPNMNCSFCGIDFYRRPSSKVNSKSGLFFCCRKHKDLAQRIGGIKEIQPPHYGETLRYRTLALRYYPNRCKNCGYDKHPEILEVNHIDCDRSNNRLENLEILCPTCHSEFHFITRTGCWASRIPSSATVDSNCRSKLI
jgi:HNH endonuclease